jgi:hypothetical protein
MYSNCQKFQENIIENKTFLWFFQLEEKQKIKNAIKRLWNSSQKISQIKSILLVLCQLIQKLNIPHGLSKQSLSNRKTSSPKKSKLHPI